MFNGPTAEWVPLCTVCHEPVSLEDAKTDENGLAIHESCYFASVKGTTPIIRSQDE